MNIEIEMCKASTLEYTEDGIPFISVDKAIKIAKQHAEERAKDKLKQLIDVFMSLAPTSFTDLQIKRILEEK